ncbi:hypothetical protein COO60DRAFT_1707554 [Scenedesmus sp. NREL 46B-D3]|nr:hypothetical protein COO60DRAFT_1707554 [Scenedesmus sp. NREL 46B-D3]
MAQQVGSLLWQAAANAASVAGAGGSSSAGAEGASCEGCGHSTELPDTTAVLVSLLAVYPGVRRLEVFTKLFSVAEVSAVSRLPQLTSLTLNSEDGVEAGALCGLSQLSTLQELRLGDVDGNNPDDVDTICSMVTHLTSLHMGYCPRLQPPVLRRLLQVHCAMQQYLQEQHQHEEQERRWADVQAAGVVGKAARAAQYAASAAGSAAASVLGVAGSSSSSSQNSAEAPYGPHMRKSEQMLLEAGVPYEALNKGGGSPNSSAVLSAAAAAAPKPEGYLPYAQQAQQRRGDQPGTAAVDASAAERAGGGPVLAAAAAASQAGRGAPVTHRRSASHSVPAASSKPSPGPSFRLVTELSVCIDAEEGQEILYEMSQLALLESLLVDSTDEFNYDPGFQPFERTTNLRKLAITMPMSLANTNSLNKCRQLRELLLCALPQDVLGRGSLSQVTRLELLDVAANSPKPDLLQAFSSVSHLIIRAGADDATLGIIGNHLPSLVHLELYQLPAGYSQGGLRGIARLARLKTLILELASPGTTLGARLRNQFHQHNPLVLPAELVAEVGSEVAAAAGSYGVPLVGTNPILAFAPPSDWGLLRKPGFSSSGWFSSLRELSVLGYVAAADHDLHALSHLTALRSLSMHLQRPRGLAGQVTLRGLWNLVELSPNLATLNLTGYMETQLLVPGRVPGVGI